MDWIAFTSIVCATSVALMGLGATVYFEWKRRTEAYRTHLFALQTDECRTVLQFARGLYRLLTVYITSGDFSQESKKNYYEARRKAFLDFDGKVGYVATVIPRPVWESYEGFLTTYLEIDKAIMEADHPTDESLEPLTKCIEAIVKTTRTRLGIEELGQETFDIISQT